MAEVSDQSRGAQRSGSRRWIPLAISALAAAAVVGVAYSMLQYLRSSTFNDERAFRVLSEVVGQFHNFENALSGLLSLAPDRVAAQRKASGVETGKARFERTIALGGKWELSFGECAAKAVQLQIDASSAARSFTACRSIGGRDASDAQLAGSFAEQAPKFLSQQFFDMAILATGDGVVLATIGAREREAGVELHKSRRDRLAIVNVAGLLQHAAIEEEMQDRGPAPDQSPPSTQRTAPTHPMVFSDDIAGDAYRVFVLGFEPEYPLQLVRGEEAKPQPQLFLVGLKRQEVLQPMLDALGASGVLTITLLALLAIMAWPLIGLRFSSAQEAISPAQVFAVLVALVLIPCLIAVSVFSVWSRYRLHVWADEQAELYARSVEAALLAELSEDVVVLDELSRQFVSTLQLRAPGDFERGEGTSAVCIGLQVEGCEHALRLPSAATPASQHNWRPLRSGAPLNLQGVSSGLRFDVAGGSAPSGRLDLKDREYVQAMQRREEWRPEDLWSRIGFTAPKHGFVAQRLFNRSDAARALQVTVPMYRGEERIGMITADSRAYALSAAVRPPLMRFAVVNRNGEVLFHSDDARSLAENLLLETEKNESLSSLLTKRASRYNVDYVAPEDHFSGRYLGAAHRFYVRPVAGLPWGVVVFYPSDSLADIVLQTSVATLAAYFAFAAAAIAAFGLIALLAPGRLDRAALAAIWPKWSSRRRYASFAGWLFATVLAAAAYLVLKLKFPEAGVWFAAAIGAALVGTWGVWRIRRRSSRERASRADVSVEAYQTTYVACLVGAMLVASVLPTIWLAVEYYDTSVRAFFRTELQQAATDVQHRRRLIANDLERIYANVQTSRPDPRTLSELIPTPGFKVRRDRISRWDVDAVAPGLWLSRCGAPVLDPVRRAIWTLSTASHARRERAGAFSRAGVARATDDDGASRRENDGDASSTSARCGSSGYGARFWLRDPGGEVLAVGMPLKSSPASDVLVRETDLIVRSTVVGPLLLVGSALFGLLVLAFLAWYVSRRLFGVRTPFAGRYVQAEESRLPVAALLEAELELLALKKQHGGSFTSKDESDWRAARCRPIYEALWKTLDRREQLLVHQLAQSSFANPENRQVIESLLRRGFLKLWPWPRVADAGFAEFLRESEIEHEFAEREREAASSWWRRVRTPLLILVIVIAALLMWLAGSAMQILSATLAGVAALFSSLTQVTNFARTTSKGQ